MAKKSSSNGASGKSSKTTKPAKAKGGGRKSKAESMTGAKENAVEMRKAGELDLQQIVIDDASFDLYFKGAKSAKETMKKYKGLYDNVLKQAKGVSVELWSAVKEAMTMESMDPADIKREIEIKGYVLKRQGSPIQISVHDTLLGSVEEAAEKRGHMDAIAGRAANSPYPEGSDLKALYMKGHQAGTMDNMKLSAEEKAKIQAQSAGPGDEEDDEIDEEVSDTEFDETGAPIAPQSVTGQADAGLH